MNRLDITITPWKPIEKPSIQIQLPEKLNEREINTLARLFLFGDVKEVRWQYGHETDPEELNGEGHYVY